MKIVGEAIFWGSFSWQASLHSGVFYIDIDVMHISGRIDQLQLHGTLRRSRIAFSSNLLKDGLETCRRANTSVGLGSPFHRTC